MALVISILSLLISGLTFWLTKVWKGDVRSTRPSMICLLGRQGDDGPKIVIRNLLYATSDQGHYLQTMHIVLRNETELINFNSWAYDDKGIVIGSGLFISKVGVC